MSNRAHDDSTTHDRNSVCSGKQHSLGDSKQVQTWTSASGRTGLKLLLIKIRTFIHYFFGATELCPSHPQASRAHMVGDHTLHTTNVTAI
jgi:hypothetical protein